MHVVEVARRRLGEVLRARPRLHETYTPPRLRGVTSRRADRFLVDAVAGEAIELVAEEVGGIGRIARRERRRLAIDLDADQPVGRLVLELDLAIEPRAQPAGQQVAPAPRCP